MDVRWQGAHILKSKVSIDEADPILQGITQKIISPCALFFRGTALVASHNQAHQIGPNFWADAKAAKARPRRLFDGQSRQVPGRQLV